MHSYAHSIIRDTDSGVGIGALVPMEKRKEVIRGIFDSFYSDKNEVCFNTNRAWTADTHLLKSLFPDFKMIVTVRDVRQILNSFEILNQKNPYTIKPLYHHRDTSSVYERSNILLGNVDGLPGYVKGPVDMLSASFATQWPDQILYVTYGSICKYPKETMQAVYEFLEEEWYDHDFDNVEASYDEYDDGAKIKDLHTIRKRVEYKKQPRVIPQDLWNYAKQYNVWENINTSNYNWIQFK